MFNLFCLHIVQYLLKLKSKCSDIFWQERAKSHLQVNDSLRRTNICPWTHRTGGGPCLSEQQGNLLHDICRFRSLKLAGHSRDLAMIKFRSVVEAVVSSCDGDQKKRRRSVQHMCIKDSKNKMGMRVRQARTFHEHNCTCTAKTCLPTTMIFEEVSFM